jgi:hypothetical protein
MKERHKRCMKKVNRGYAFEFSTKNYAEKKHNTEETNEVIIQPSFNFSGKTQEELHYVINKGLLNVEKTTKKLEQKKRPTIEDRKMIDTNAKMIQAFITLANTTLLKNDEGYVFDRLNIIDVELKQRMPQLRNKNNPDGSNEENEL